MQEIPFKNKDEEGTWSKVIELFRQRDRTGVERYGTPLGPFNGRDSLWDAIEEECDKIVYMYNAWLEKDNLRKAIALEIKNKIIKSQMYKVQDILSLLDDYVEGVDSDEC